MSEFTLHPRLEADTIMLGRFPLSLLLLHKDANYPWFILVPQRPGLTEIHQLSDADRDQLMKESCQLAKALEQLYSPDKLNLATIGNMVPQLHFHHVVRFESDPAWPAPIWGAVPAVEYEPGVMRQQIDEICKVLMVGAFKPSSQIS
ncbi:HIT domain-containing protein [Porticoccaceae bacterium LTM1]|nr:HIT domain-containing protein [Porticoccaceae bacterium LTM1]